MWTADFRLRGLVAWLLIVLLLIVSGCSTKPSQPPLEPKAPQIPAPPAALMAPIPESPVNVQQLYESWTQRIDQWRRQREDCKATPQKCA